MTRRFLVVSHTTPPDGDWSLEDLAGGAGRVDVLCRAVTSALCTSHGLRDDTEVLLVFASDPQRATAVRFDGAQIRHLNPDERSTAARIQQALRARPEDPWWDEVQAGLHVAPFALAEVLGELEGPLFLLDAAGDDALKTALPAAGTFVLSDHRPFTEEETALLAEGAAGRFSLGEAWYHGHHCIAVVQTLLDRQGAGRGGSK
ncbi:MAG: tRNA (pseudouridine(54)-N(1))-methyltransferase TrmY [Thermoplasmatota archaeon]